MFESCYRVNVWESLEAVNRKIYTQLTQHHLSVDQTKKVTGLLDYATFRPQLLASTTPINVKFDRETNKGVPVSLYLASDESKASRIVLLMKKSEVGDDEKILNDLGWDILNGALRYDYLQNLANLMVYVLVGNVGVEQRNNNDWIGEPCRLYEVKYQKFAHLGRNDLKEVEYSLPVNSVLAAYSFNKYELRKNIEKATSKQYSPPLT